MMGLILDAIHVLKMRREYFCVMYCVVSSGGHGKKQAVKGNNSKYVDVMDD